MEKQQVNMKSFEFLPNNEYILVKPESKIEKITDGGIIVPLTSKQNTFDRSTGGEVVSVGTEVEKIRVNDFVIWPTTDGLDLIFDDGEFILIRQKSVIGTKIK